MYLLGHFIQSISSDKQNSIVTIPFSEWNSIIPGTPVVAVENIELLKKTGLPTKIRFGIAAPGKQVIVQECTKEDMTSPEFQVRKIAMAIHGKDSFCPWGWTLHCPATPILHADDVLKRAEEKLQTPVIAGMRSYPGDDFVAECMDEAPIRQCEDNPAIGQHWWTPLHYTLEEIRQLAEESAGIKIPLPKSPIDPELLHFRHHGIVIESNWVIHFATPRVPEKVNRIKLDTIDTFCNITPYAEEKGGPLNYKDDTAEKRLFHRNRAVWILCHADTWGKYNLLSNNCEHMSRMCKVGKKESKQVRETSVQVIFALLGLILPASPWFSVLLALSPAALTEVLQRLSKSKDTPPEIQE